MKFSKLTVVAFVILLALFSGLIVQILVSLPKVETLDTYIPSESTILFSLDNKPLARFHKEENRRVVPLARISPYILKAVVAIEDERFYSHHGIDFEGILRATFKNFLYGRIVEGGSTITQQLARNLFLTRQKSIIRKLAEAILAFQIERRFTKQEILEYYLNQIYFGHNAYGIESASQLYFDKHAKDLTLAESAMLAGIIEGPEIFSPYKDFTLAKKRQKLVLSKMADLSMAPQSQAKLAYKQQIEIYPENLKKFGNLAPYFVNYIFNELMEKFGEEVVTKGGLKVYTTLDPDMQIAAEDAVSHFVNEESKKYNFSQAALLAIDPRNGYIKAMVGGSNFIKSQYNRAIQSKRQPGSSFKPFIYAAAIEQEISPGIILKDAPITFNVFPNRWNPKGNWSPKNFDGKFRGNVTMQYALEKSLNIPSIELLQKVGIQSAIDMARKLGIKSKLEPALSLALGASEVSMLEMVSAFSVFANNGVKVEPTAILKIIDRNGNVLYENKPEENTVLDSNVAAIMDMMMERVILSGTGVRARLDRPAAAKTGTSQDFKDAWFIGFTPQLAAGVWVGNDNNSPMKGVAEVAVCPRLWKEFMMKALSGQPVYGFEKPEGLTPVKICLSSGLLPTPFCPQKRIVTGWYFEKDIPKTECTVHSSQNQNIEDDENIDIIPEENDEENLNENN